MFGMDLWVGSMSVLLVWAGCWSFFQVVSGARKAVKR